MGIIVSTVSTIDFYSHNPIIRSKLLGEGNLEKRWMAREDCHVNRQVFGEEDESTSILMDPKFAVIFVAVAWWSELSFLVLLFSFCNTRVFSVHVILWGLEFPHHFHMSFNKINYNLGHITRENYLAPLCPTLLWCGLPSRDVPGPSSLLEKEFCLLDFTHCGRHISNLSQWIGRQGQVGFNSISDVH